MGLVRMLYFGRTCNTDIVAARSIGSAGQKQNHTKNGQRRRWPDAERTTNCRETLNHNGIPEFTLPLASHPWKCKRIHNNFSSNLPVTNESNDYYDPPNIRRERIHKHLTTGLGSSLECNRRAKRRRRTQ